MKVTNRVDPGEFTIGIMLSGYNWKSLQSFALFFPLLFSKNHSEILNVASSIL